LLVDPGAGVVVIGVDTIGEPELDLVLGGLDGIGAMADVAADVDAIITTDGAGERGGGVGLAEHDAASLDGVEALPDHAADGAGRHVLNQTGEELLFLQVSVVLLQVLDGGGLELQGLELEALLFEALDDLANEATLDTVGLDHDVGALLLRLAGSDISVINVAIHSFELDHIGFADW